MKKSDITRINYYKTYDEDIVKNSKQNYKLPKDLYGLIILFFIKSKIIYFIVWIFGFFYCKFALNVKIENRKI